MPVTASGTPGVTIVRSQPSTDIGANADNTSAETTYLKTVPGLTGGSGKPYRLTPTANEPSWFTNVLGLGGSYSAYTDYIQTFNTNSEKIAKQYGVNSPQYSKWLNESLGGPGSISGPSASPAQAAKDVFKPTDLLSMLADMQTWIRVGEGIAGVVAIAFGIMLLARDLGVSVPEPVRAIVRTSKGVAK